MCKPQCMFVDRIDKKSGQNKHVIWYSVYVPVAALKMNEVLKELFIGDNKLMSTDGVQVGNLLKFNHKLELLDLRNNHLQVGGKHFYWLSWSVIVLTCSVLHLDMNRYMYLEIFFFWKY